MRVNTGQTSGKKYVPAGKAEALAVAALRKEQPSQAMTAWNDLKTLVKDDPASRSWYLVAAQKYRELADKSK